MFRVPLILALMSTHCMCSGAQAGEQLTLGMGFSVAKEGGRVRRALSWIPGVKSKKRLPPRRVPGDTDVTLAIGAREQLVRFGSMETYSPTRWHWDGEAREVLIPVFGEAIDLAFEIRLEAVRDDTGALTVLGSYTIHDLAGYESSHARIEGTPLGQTVALPIMMTVVGRFSSSHLESATRLCSR